MALRAFNASFKLLCACCGDNYPPGTLVYYSPDGKLSAVECVNRPEGSLLLLTADREDGGEEAEYLEVSTAEQRHARQNMCPKCFMVKPKSNVCGTCD